MGEALSLRHQQVVVFLEILCPCPVPIFISPTATTTGIQLFQALCLLLAQVWHLVSLASFVAAFNLRLPEVHHSALFFALSKERVFCWIQEWLPEPGSRHTHRSRVWGWSFLLSVLLMLGGDRRSKSLSYWAGDAGMAVLGQQPGLRGSVKNF